MTAAPHPAHDRTACRHWAPSRPFGGHRLGIYPAWNAVALLNEASAAIWDRLRAEGAPRSAEDRMAIAAWARDGFLAPPAPPTPTAAPDWGRPDWRLDRTILAGGTAVRIRVADDALAAALRDQTADFPAAEGAAREIAVAAERSGGLAVAVDGRVQPTARRRGLSPGSARSALVAELARVAGNGDWAARLHLTAVTDGREALLLAGESGRGKTTLALALLARGWRLLAEDLAPIDRDARIHPLPFRPSVKAGGVGPAALDWPSLRQLDAHRLDGRLHRFLRLPPAAAATAPARPTRLLAVAHDPGSTPRAHPLTAIEALALLLSERSHLDFAHPGSGALLDCIEALPAHAIRYPDTGSALRLIDRLTAP